MNKDFRLSTAFFTHPKTIKLQRKLGSDGVLAFIKLLAFTAANRPSGVLDKVDDETLAIATDYDDIDSLVAVLVEIGFLDKQRKQLSVHDWADHNGYAMHAKARSEKARKAAKAKWDKEKSASSEHATSMQQAESSTAPSPTPTPEPDPSPDPVVPITASTRFKKPTVQEVKAYCHERGNNIDPIKFVNHYEAKGWMIGKTPMKDWKAAVRTWEQRDETPKTEQAGEQYW